MSGALWVAVAGIAAGVVGNAGGLLYAYWNSHSERRHASALSRASRLHAQRLDVYSGISAEFERDKAFMLAAMVELEAGQVIVPYPERSPEREESDLLGRAAVTVSGGTVEAIEAARIAVVEFSHDMVAMQGLEIGSAEFLRLRGQMYMKRDDAITAIAAAQQALRVELETL
jgi:hypothetical protein